MQFSWRKRVEGFVPSIVEGPKQDLHQGLIRLEMHYFNLFVLGDSQK